MHHVTHAHAMYYIEITICGSLKEVRQVLTYAERSEAKFLEYNFFRRKETIWCILQ